VVDYRSIRSGRASRRRRECGDCGHRFTTYETVDAEPVTVKKRSGAIEPYDRSKLLESVRVACAKRPVSLSEIEGVVDRVEDAINRSDRREIPTRRIGEMVMEGLRRLDQVAYVRFASVYRNFQDTSEFTDEVRELLRRQRFQSRGQGDLFEDSEEQGGEDGS
jgi:transcriptional repressor NrdR